MKKLIAMLVCGTMLAGMTITASATALDGQDASNPATGKGEGSYTINVTGNYTPAAAGSTVSIDVAWDAMSFDYNEASTGTWLPGEHRYDTAGVATAGWSTDKKKITVTNHSDTEVTATLGFTNTSGVELVGTFYSYDGQSTYQSLSDSSFDLESAVGTEVSAAPKAETWFGISGAAITETKALGTISVTIQKSNWQKVSTEAQLIAALANGGRIRLMNEIDLHVTSTFSPCLTVSSDTIIDCNGNDLFCSGSVESSSLVHGGILMQINSGVTCVIKDNTATGSSISNFSGGIMSGTNTNYGEYAAVIINNGTLKCKAITLETFLPIQNDDNASLWLENCWYGYLPTSGYSNAISGGNTTFRGFICHSFGDDETHPTNITILPGTYQEFDPTSFVDNSKYTVTQDPDNEFQWFVTEK